MNSIHCMLFVHKVELDNVLMFLCLVDLNNRQNWFFFSSVSQTDARHVYFPDLQQDFGTFHFFADSDASDIIKGLNDDSPDVLNSFYYHPSIEIDYINFNTILNDVRASQYMSV